MKKISLFRHIKDNSEPKLYDPVDIIESIIDPSPRVQKQISEIRECEDDSEKHKLKGKLPSIVFQGEMSEVVLNRKEQPTYREDESLAVHSGLCVIDLDKVGDEFMAEVARDDFAKDPHVFAAFVSPSGNGVKVVFRIPADIERPRGYYRGVMDYVNEKYPEYGATQDDKCLNESRICYASYDEEAHLNEDAKVLKRFVEDKPKGGLKTTPRKKATSTTGSKKIMKPLVKAIEKSEDGEKHDILNKVAYLAGGYVTNGHISFDEAQRILQEAIEAKDGVADIKAAFETIYRGIEDGQADPADPDPDKEVISKKEKPRKSMKWRIHEGVEEYVKNQGFKINILTGDIYDKRGVNLSNSFRGFDPLLTEVRGKIDPGIPMEKLKTAAFTSAIYFHPYDEFIQEHLKYNPAPAEGYDTHLDQLLDTIIFDEPVTEEYRELVKKWFWGLISNILRTMQIKDNPSDPDWKSVAPVKDHSFYVNRICLTLIGKGQYTGKTTFFENLLPDELRDKVRIAKYSQILNTNQFDVSPLTNLLTVIDEIGVVNNTHGIDNFKAIISNPLHTFEIKNKQGSHTKPRLTSYAATSNRPDILIDPGGTSRMVICNILGIDKEKYPKVDKLALFMELYRDVIAKPNRYLMDEDQLKYLYKEQDRNKRVSKEMEALQDYFELPNHENYKDCLVLKLGDIEEIIKTFKPKTMISSSHLRDALDEMGVKPIKARWQTGGEAYRRYVLHVRVSSLDVNNLVREIKKWFDEAKMIAVLKKNDLIDWSREQTKIAV